MLCGALLLASLVTGVARAQGTGMSVLAGVVLDSAGVAIADARISVDPGGLRAITDAGGKFYMRVPVGRVMIHARRLGFVPLETDAHVQSGRSTEVRLVLRPAVQALPSVETRGRTSYMPPGAPAFLDDFYRRRAEGKGLYFTREDFENVPSLASVIRTVPSMRVREDAFGQIASVRAARCISTEHVAWYVDGMRISGELAGIDLNLAGIEAMEVYRGSSSLPAEAIGNACAAIYIWTRRAP